MDKPVRILIVEDLPTDAELAEREIRKTIKSSVFRQVDTREEFLAALESFKPDIIVSDYRMPRFDGLAALRLTQEHAPLTPLVILTGAMNEDTAVECMKAGAADYVIKEHIKRLGQALVHALEESEIRRKRRLAEEEKARLEFQLIQAQKMECIGRLAGGIAHDFNNMLVVILGRAELVKCQLPPDDPVLKNILEIENAAIHSRDIIRQLLAFSRKQVISPKPVKLNEHIVETRKTLAHLIGDNIELRFHPGEDVHTIKFDPSQLDQILLNLAVNARDAMPNGGKLTIRTSNVARGQASDYEPSLSVPVSSVLLEVSDEGIGMDEATLAHIFEPFFTTKDPGRGTGLGLSTVYGIVKQNNGHIRVSSKPDRGTTFSILIPSTACIETPRKESKSPVAATSGTILLVEDAQPVREAITEVLEAIGYTVLAAETPLQALSLSKSTDIPIDLLISDVVMPEMSGIELREKIAAIRPQLNVLFLSGYAADAVADLCIQREGIHFMQKPFSIEALARMIREITSESRSVLGAA